MWLFKLIGLVLLFSACALGGFLKSFALMRRQKKLNSIYRSMSDLGERIRIGYGDINSLAKLSFKGDTLIFCEYGIEANSDFLEKEDAEILNEFFADIGMGDAVSECERLSIYMNLIERKCEESRQKCNELCKLYNTLGILCGIFICIFFL